MQSSFSAGSIGARARVIGMASHHQTAVMAPIEMKKRARGVRKVMHRSVCTMLRGFVPTSSRPALGLAPGRSHNTLVAPGIFRSAFVAPQARATVSTKTMVAFKTAGRLKS